MESIVTDVLVAGGGVGGLLAAHSAALAGARVLLVGGSPGASHQIGSINTAQRDGDGDMPADLFDDIFRAGNYLSRPSVLAAITTRIASQIETLESLGVPLVRSGASLARRRTAGTTMARSVFTKGMVGADILRVMNPILADHADVTVMKGAELIDVSTDDSGMSGGLVFDAASDSCVRVAARAVVLATGGAGQLFGRSTNPSGSRALGYALALQAGAELVDMEFIGFEPFVIRDSLTGKSKSLPTTLVSEGARLVNALGEEFLGDGPLPPKDVICRAMAREVEEGRGAVLYDVSDVPPEVLARYGKVRDAVKKTGSTLLVVAPAQHFVVGGTRVDGDGAARVPGLYAVGEVAGGAHGAHRLAGSGGTEVVALGGLVGQRAAEHALATRTPTLRDQDVPWLDIMPRLQSGPERDEFVILRDCLDTSCGLSRNEDRAAAADERLTAMLERSSVSGSRRLARATSVALTVVRSVRARQESRGDHHRDDFPNRLDAKWFGHTVFARDPAGHLSASFERIGESTLSLSTGQHRDPERDEKEAAAT